ncbi:phage tail protein [Salmonella enterica subsp. enterica serovar Durban]|nr:phage tail protein [Salmonella enterica]EBW4733126.1 phage tail protein [Salmonella enterica subsp. enterica serovar Durban]EHG9908129.1 phage tail protein [Salmonella enterica]EHN1339114.1 phage tail protein [Salmonella enterica subsp. enterica serovar Durban]
MADYYSIITNRGKELEAEALVSGRLIVLTHFVVGDSNGKQVKPDPAQIRLINETYRGDIAELVVSPEQSTQLMAKIVLPTGVGGFTVREVGLMTEAGELYAVANCPSIDKPVGGVSVNMQFRLAVSDTSNITLNVATGDGLFLRIDQNLKEIKARGAEAQRTSRESIGVLDGTTQQRGLVQLSSSVNSASETEAATPAVVKIAMDNANARLAKERNGADIPNVPLFLQNLGLVDVLFKGDGRFLAGTFVSDAIDRTSIGARAATGCQFMRAHQAPDAPDQVSYWQIITLTEVVSPTSVVDVLAISGNNVLFGHGTGAGITSWRNVAMLEGAAFTGDISAPNMRGDTLVTVGDGSGGMATGGVDGAGFNGNNLNIKSWNGIGFQNSADLAIRAYISTRLGVIAAAENLQAGNAIFNKNGDVYGDIWGIGSGPGWLSAYIAGRPLRQYITMVGVYQNDKTKPFMLHDDGSGVFLATTDMLSGYVQSIRFGATEQGNVYRSPGFADQLGYVITGVENGDSNDTPDRIQRRLLQLKVNGQWYTVGA